MTRIEILLFTRTPTLSVRYSACYGNTQYTYTVCIQFSTSRIIFKFTVYRVVKSFNLLSLLRGNHPDDSIETDRRTDG